MSQKLTLELHVSAYNSLALIAKLKGISEAQAALLMIEYGCELLDAGKLHSDQDLKSDLDFSREYRVNIERHLDEVISLAEKTLLDSQGIQKGLQSRLFNLTK